jgi:hypothetical protein
MEGYDPIEYRRRSEWPLRLLIVFVLAIPFVLGFLAYRFYSRPVEPDALKAGVAAGARAAGAPTPTLTPYASSTPLPQLEQSDAFVRALVSALSSNPAWVRWLATEGLVRRFVVVVDNVAEGIAPTKQLGMVAPKDRFAAVERGGSYYVDPASFRRYDTIAEVVASLDTKGCARSYRQLKPLVQDAYRELGYPDRDFDVTLAKAIDRLLGTPAPQGEIRVAPGVKNYKLADADLESLSPAQRQFLRMGPANEKKVQTKLRELREELALPKT